MKIACKCGEKITDTGCEQDNKGTVIRSGSEEEFDETMSSGLAALITAYSTNEFPSWLEKWHPETSTWKVDWNDPAELKSLVYDYMSTNIHRYSDSIYQCDSCGRVVILNGSKIYYFQSESSEWDSLKVT